MFFRLDLVRFVVSSFGHFMILLYRGRLGWPRSPPTHLSRIYCLGPYFSSVSSLFARSCSFNSAVISSALHSRW